MSKLFKFALLLLPVVRIFLSAVCLLNGQVVTFAGPAVNFGEVNACGDPTAGGPCFALRTLTYHVAAGGTLGKPRVLTAGAENLDFTLAGGTCSGSVITGSSCTVLVKWTPTFAGQRAGAAQIVDQGGTVLATAFLRGIGVGPQAVVSDAHPIPLAASPYPNIPWSGVAVDGAGNIFFSNGERAGGNIPPAIWRFSPHSGAPVAAATGFTHPQGVAVDGAGNLYVTDVDTNQVIKVPRGCSDSHCYLTLDDGFATPNGVAVDGAGTVYVADSGNNRVVAMPSGCATRACAQTVGSGLKFPVSVAADGGGAVFIADLGNQRIVRVAGGKQSTVGANHAAHGIAVDAAGDLLITDPARDLILEQPASGGEPRILASLTSAPMGIALDGAGNVFYTNTSTTTALSELARGQVPLHRFATSAAGTVSGDSPQHYRVQNVGNAVLSLTGLSLGLGVDFVQVPADSVRSVECEGGLFLAPGASCDLSLAFAPTITGLLTGTAVLTDNSLNATNANQWIPLAGAGGPPSAFDIHTVPPFSLEGGSPGGGVDTSRNSYPAPARIWAAAR